MNQPLSLLEERWIQENNELVNKCKQEKDSSGQDRNQTHLRGCSSEFNKLLRKIQGIPPTADHLQVELAVVYNASVCSAALSLFSEAELLLTQATDRVQQMTGGDPGTSDPVFIWKAALRSVGNKSLDPGVLNLLCLQWAIWLATHQLKVIQEFQELSSLCEVLCSGGGNSCRNDTRGKFSDKPLLVMDPRRLAELLQICTSITQGAERLSEGCGSEALSILQAASTLPAPRALVAYTHFLSGCCLAQMSRPQMALLSYKQALETDSCCVCALYQSMLLYKQMGNTQAEIQALRLLHSTLMLPSAAESAHLLSPSSLLNSQSLSRLLSVPSALSVLHSLALQCVSHGRVSEGVEFFLDLLATLHSEDQHLHGEVSSLPKLPELYLETSAALLMARRTADCMALCSEIISTTLEMLPEKVVFEDEEQSGDSKMQMLLWAAAAYLLQGHCSSQIKDWKQAVTQYTRCVNLLVRVRFTKRFTGSTQLQTTSADMDVKWEKEMHILQRLKGLSLAGRGISFGQSDQLKEALRDLQLGLQAAPECEGAGLWCGEVLWKLGRRREAAACWEKTWSLTTKPSIQSLPVYLQEPKSGPLLDSSELRHRIQKELVQHSQP